MLPIKTSLAVEIQFHWSTVRGNLNRYCFAFPFKKQIKYCKISYRKGKPLSLSLPLCVYIYKIDVDKGSFILPYSYMYSALSQTLLSSGHFSSFCKLVKGLKNVDTNGTTKYNLIVLPSLPVKLIGNFSTDFLMSWIGPLAVIVNVLERSGSISWHPFCL